MKLDDLLGLLFFLLFILAPVVKGLLKREAPLETELLPPPPPPPPEEEPEKKAKPPRPRPVVVAAPSPGAEPEAQPPPARKRRKKKRRTLRVRPGGILEGIVWHEILSEPRGKRPWKPKR